MERRAFKMKLLGGFAAEYKKRHDEIWPALASLLKQNGVSDYSIFLDEETNYLFATLKVEDAALLDDLPKNAVMQEWWQYMRYLMECNDDNSPVSIPMKEVFYLK